MSSQSQTGGVFENERMTGLLGDGSELHAEAQLVGANAKRSPSAERVALTRSYYSSGQAAQILGIPARTMRHYLAKGRIPGVQNPITKTWQIRRETLVEIIEREGKASIIGDRPAVIVVIDDDQATVSSMRRAVETSLPGAELCFAKNACDALIQIGVLQPDIIAIDARMPVISGRDLLHAIRSNPTTAMTKVLALGAIADELNELIALGADDVLEKPINVQTLASKLERLSTRAAIPEAKS